MFAWAWAYQGGFCTIVVSILHENAAAQEQAAQPDHRKPWNSR